MRTLYSLADLCAHGATDEHSIIEFIRLEWIRPARPDEFDHEDLARLRLIRELGTDLLVNPEGIDLVLQLLDHVHALRNLLAQTGRLAIDPIP